MKNILFELFLPTTRSLVEGIFIEHLVDGIFLKIINTHFIKLNRNNNEIYILQTILTLTSISIIHAFFKKMILLQRQLTLSGIKKYYEFCTKLGLKQLIEIPTRVTCSSSTIYWSHTSKLSQQSFAARCCRCGTLWSTTSLLQ